MRRGVVMQLCNRLRVNTAVLLFVAVTAAYAPVAAQHGARDGEWHHYAGDVGGTKYSSLDQINKDNVKDLRIAWRWKSDNFGVRPDSYLQSTPVMAHGVLYTVVGTRRDVVAIDAA